MAQPPATATRTQVARKIAADPTSTALLLAGPTALELWPGVRKVGKASGRIVVETEINDAATAASVRALPPQRTPTSYLTRFEWAGPGLPATSAELTLNYAPADDGGVATQAQLILHSSGFEGTVLDQHTLLVMAQGFLDNLAHAAELRNRAA